MPKIFCRRILPLLCAAMLLVAGCGTNQHISQNHGNNTDYQKIRLVMTTPGTADSADTLIARRIAESVSEASGGNVLIEVYDNDRLAGGNTTQGVRMIADGSVDIAVYSSGTLSKLDYHMAVAALPWVFDDYTQARQVIDETGSAYYEKILAQQGLHFLGSAHNGMRQLSNNQRPIRTPDDIAGLRIRILGNDANRFFFQSYEALPIPMSRSEISDALRQGIIDGHDIGFFQLHSVALTNLKLKYLTEWHYSYENYIFIANSKTFDQIDAKTQALIKEKTLEACEWGRDLVEENERAIKKYFIDNGVIITELSPTELDAFKKRVEPIVTQLKRHYGEEACRAFRIPYE